MKTYVLMLAGLTLGACAAGSEGQAPKAAAGPVAPQGAGSSGETRASYEQQLGRDPKNVKARINLAVMKEREWNLAGAVSELEHALSLDPKSLEATVALARVMVRQGKAEAAESLLNAARKQTGDAPALLNALSSVARARKRLPEAIAYAKVVLLHDQNDLEAMNGIALAYLAMGKLESAELYAQTALKRAQEKTRSALTVTLGLIAQKRGDAQKAMALFDEALASDPNNAVAHANVGFVALEYRDYAQAEKSFDAAIARGHADKDVMTARCYALEGLKKGPEAVSCLETVAAKLTPEDAQLPGVLYALGMVHQSLTRDSARALQAFRRYVDLKGTSLSKSDRVLDMIRKLEGDKAEADDTPVKEELKPKAEIKQVKKKRASKKHRRFIARNG